MRTFSRTLGTLALLAGSANLVFGSTISFNGTFLIDGQSEVFKFVAAAGAPTIVSFGYAGGTNGAAMRIPVGGFDTYFSLWDSTGNFVDNNNDGGCAHVGKDASTDSCSDAFLSGPTDPNLTLLTPGSTYTLVLTQWENTEVDTTLADGFTMQGQAAFTCDAFGGTPGGKFCDSTPSQRNGNWAVDFVGVTSATDISAATPEPGTIFLMALGALALPGLRRYRKQIQ